MYNSICGWPLFLYGLKIQVVPTDKQRQISADSNGNLRKENLEKWIYNQKNDQNNKFSKLPSLKSLFECICRNLALCYALGHLVFQMLLWLYGLQFPALYASIIYQKRWYHVKGFSISFKILNIISWEFAFKNRIIFCRNVKYFIENVISFFFNIIW